MFIGFLSLSTLYADTLKECKNEADKISGCVERIYHSNGRLWMEKPYKNGKKEGVERLYHGDMSIFVEMPFKNDKPEGIRRWYYENGNIKTEAIYKDNKQEGVIKMYYTSGNLRAEVSALNHVLHGDTKFYTEDKKLFAIIKKRYGETIFSKCLNGKVLTNEELSEYDILKSVEKAIKSLQEICLKESDSR